MKRPLLALAVLLVVIAALYGFTAYQQAQAPLAAVDPYNGWGEVTTNGVTFRYPEVFPVTYVSPVVWPPEVSRSTGYGCVAGGQPGFMNEEKVVQGTTYCVSTISEGAAGSTYVEYQYLSARYTLQMTLRYPQCMNYDEPQQGTCLLEQQSLDLDTLVDHILSSAR